MNTPKYKLNQLVVDINKISSTYLHSFNVTSVHQDKEDIWYIVEDDQMQLYAGEKYLEDFYEWASHQQKASAEDELVLTKLQVTALQETNKKLKVIIDSYKTCLQFIDKHSPNFNKEWSFTIKYLETLGE